MRRWIHSAVAVAVLVPGVVGPASAVHAQEPELGRAGFVRAVADFYQVTTEEVGILSDWGLPVPEVAVALFIASRSGVSAEALVALRGTGRSWGELAGRYHLDASHFHVPLPSGASAGPLNPAYEGYRSMEPRQWSSLRLDDEQILMLVNVRILSQTLRVSPEAVLARVRPGRSFVEVYADMVRSPRFQDGAGG